MDFDRIGNDFLETWKMSFDSGCLSTLLPIYYKRLFPSRLLTAWLSYGNNAYFQRREFAFILPDDVYLRYRSFNDPLEFERDLIKTAPEKVDIGAVYNYKPKEDRHKKDLTAIERELVFDIDMTDYDDVRTCCKGAGLCRKCWLFMVVAIKVVDAALEDDFGFKERLWVFSGRRGVHCWVSDVLARKLSGSARSAIIEYLTVSSAGERSKTVELKARTIHYSVKRACCILEKYFPKMVAQQGWLDNAESVEKMLSLITSSEFRDHLQKRLEGCETGLQRWQCFVKVKNEVQIPAGSTFFLEEIMLQYAYPRLDTNVTKGVNHLLKGPFCIHAKTGKVCIPLSTVDDELTNFDPDAVPRIDQLHAELAAFGKDTQVSAVEMLEETPARKSLDFKQTSLKPHIEFFERFVHSLRPNETEKDVSMDF